MKERNKVKYFIGYLFHDHWKLVDRMVVQYGWWLPDSWYIHLRYRAKMGARLNLRHPETFNEKINWLKLHNKKPEYTQMVDKLAAKEYVANKVGAQFIVPTIGVWDSADEIEWERLPDKFVLKTTHGGGGNAVVICRGKDTFDRQAAITKFRASMNSTAGRSFREYPYYDVPKRILAEQLLETTPPVGDLLDYKFFCFNGKVRFFKIDFGRFVEHHANYYSTSGQLLPFGEADYPPVPHHVELMPENLTQMIAIAESLSTNIPFLRVDLYNIAGKVYFGEMTFFPAAGMGRFIPESADLDIGRMLNLKA